MRGNSHVQFLGGPSSERKGGYPTAALRRPSLMCRHKLRRAQRRGPSATCPGFARFRRIFAGFSPVLARFDCFIAFFPASLLPRRNPPQAHGGRGGRSNGPRKRHSSGTKASGTKACPEKRAGCENAAAARQGGPIRVWRPSPGPARPNPLIGELAALAFLASAGSPKPSTG